MATINLLVQVQIHISRKFDRARADSSPGTVYVALWGQEELYKVSCDNKSFDIC